jgi:hypothetical protein
MHSTELSQVKTYLQAKLKILRSVLSLNVILIARIHSVAGRLNLFMITMHIGVVCLSFYGTPDGVDETLSLLHLPVHIGKQQILISVGYIISKQSRSHCYLIALNFHK